MGGLQLKVAVLQKAKLRFDRLPALYRLAAVLPAVSSIDDVTGARHQRLNNTYSNDRLSLR
jgi:hypothetical protein